MNTQSTDFLCPFCGGADFSLTDDGLFLCGFCGKKFMFDLDNLNPSKNDQVYLDNLAQTFSDALTKLYAEKQSHYSKLLYYRKLAYPNTLITLGLILLFASLVFLYYTLIMLISLSVSIIILICSRKVRKARYKQYKSYMRYHAAKIVECDEKISIFTKLLSKLNQ